LTVQVKGEAPETTEQADDFINPNNEYTVKPPPVPLIATAWRFVSQRLLNLAVVTTFVTVAGFFVVHTYLAKITGIYTYRVDGVVYVAAGFNMVLAIVTTFVRSLISNIWLSLLIAALMILAAYGIEYGISKNEKLRRFFEERIIPIVRIVSKLFSLTMIFLTAVFALAIGIVYGQYGYEYSSRSLGGGMPATVILLFKDPQLMPTLGLPLSLNVTYPAQSEPVELLMELSDGVLVRDPQQQIAVIVRDDLLYGMIDVPTATPVPTSTPTPSSPLPTPTT